MPIFFKKTLDNTPRICNYGHVVGGVVPSSLGVELLKDLVFALLAALAFVHGAQTVDALVEPAEPAAVAIIVH